jgi:hypothetical protein
VHARRRHRHSPPDGDVDDELAEAAFLANDELALRCASRKIMPRSQRDGFVTSVSSFGREVAA